MLGEVLDKGHAPSLARAEIKQLALKRHKKTKRIEICSKKKSNLSWSSTKSWALVKNSAPTTKHHQWHSYINEKPIIYCKNKDVHICRIPNLNREQNLQSNTRNGRILKQILYQVSVTVAFHQLNKMISKQEIQDWRISPYSRSANQETSKNS